MTAPAPRPGWYADPGDPRLMRYWDGAAWTAHAKPLPPQTVTPAPWPPVGLVREQAAPLRRRSVPWWAVVAAAAVALLLFLTGVGVASIAGSDEVAARPTVATESPTPSSSPSEAAASASPTQTTEPEPERSPVPSMVGMAAAKAERALEKQGLVAVVSRRVPSGQPVGTVLRQSKRAGKALLVGSTVALVLAAPYLAVPGTAGLTQVAATQRLRDAGFRVTVVREVVTSGRNGVVLRQSPIGTTRLRPGSVITVVVASVVRPVAAPQPAASCTPGYTPCLAPASDYDCSGGSGDGPRYTGYVTVTGSDPYDLDADGDGVACEG